MSESEKEKFQRSLRLNKKFEPDGVAPILLSFKTTEIAFDAILVETQKDSQVPIWGGKMNIMNSQALLITSVNVENRLKLIPYKKEGGTYKRSYCEIKDVQITIDRKGKTIISGKSEGGYFEFIYKGEINS